MPIPVILDVDTGVDDALALLLAGRSPELDLLAVTCVHGNVELEHVVPNTLNVLAAAGCTDVPVAAGANQPLQEPPRHARGVHGHNGIGGLELAASPRAVEREPAVELLRRTILESREPVTLVPLAPMTNIATLLTRHPEVRDNIARIAFMGGAIGAGNASAAAEFNVRQDPEAADIVLQSGLPTLMYGLEVFRQVAVTRDEANELTDSGTPTAHLAGELLRARMDEHNRDAALIGDAGCVAAVIDPDGLTTHTYPVRVELEGTWTRGETVVDQREHHVASREEPWQPSMDTEIDVATDVDAGRYARLFIETVSG